MNRRLLQAGISCAAAALGLASLPGAQAAAAPATAPALRAAQAPFSCDGQILLSAGQQTTQLFEGMSGPGTVEFTPVGEATVLYNAIGINPEDNVLYGLTQQGSELVRIEDDGTVTNLGPVDGLPTDETYFAGAVGEDGTYYVHFEDVVYAIDLATQTATELPLTPGGRFPDFTFSGGYLWGVDFNTDQIGRIDPETGEVTTYPGVLPAGIPAQGGAFTYGNGDLGFYGTDGQIRRVALANPDDPTLTLISTQDGPAQSQNTDATSCFDQEAETDLAIVKDGPAVVQAGGEVTYTLTVTNNGPDDSTGYVVNDELPEGLADPTTDTPGCEITDGALSCTGGPLPVGESDTITVTGTATGEVSPLENTATVTGNETDPVEENNTDDATTTITPVPEEGVDLAVDKTGPARVDEGGTVTYTITVTNNGPEDSTGYTLTDEIPAGLEDAATTTEGCEITDGVLTCEGGPLAVGESDTITLTGTAADGATRIVNSATVDGNETDPIEENNTDDATTRITDDPPPVDDGVDLEVDKTGPAKVDEGGTVTYTITVTNNGPEDSTGYTLTDEIPAGLEDAATTTEGCEITGDVLTCEGGPLAVGESDTITLTGTAADGATRIVNSATVDGNETDPVPANDTDDATTVVHDDDNGGGGDDDCPDKCDDKCGHGCGGKHAVHQDSVIGLEQNQSFD